MRVSRHLLAGAAVAALGFGTALADEPSQTVAPPPVVSSTPLPAPKAAVAAPEASKAAVAPSPQAVKPIAAQSPAATPAVPAAVASPAAAPSPLATPAVAAPKPATGSAEAPAPIPVDVAPKPKPHRRPAPPALQTALSTNPTPTLSPDTLAATQKAEARYGQIVEDGGWATDLPPMHPGSRGEAVVRLRRHLALEGDLASSEASRSRWDGALTAAVKHFQERMGLRQTGFVSGETLKAINVSAQARHEELAASAARLSMIHPEFPRRYVVVNLPSTQVEAVEDGRVAHHYIAIVGNPDHPSPEIAAHISVINLNPTWTVPTSIIKKEIIPHILRDPSYLAREHIRVLDGQLHEINPRSVDWNTERAANYIIRQDSGAGNALGSIRIGMPNKLAVYMHDTPGKALFGRDFRFLSHGCVRVEGVWDYAAWLLEDTPGDWDKARLLEKMRTKERFDIKLSHAVPVYWVYLTGWANADGVVNFRNDVYGIDPVAEANAAAFAAKAEQQAAETLAPPSAPPPPAPLSLSPIFNFLSGR
jgi:murein L,D-transpeptidase YcbB/YkuD